ncbi:MAG: hypothetical protein EOM26_02710 [Alphaproteobacteria bacterium]|nr:hypothetical protein [Alphaproteobacteria bacterium]
MTEPSIQELGLLCLKDGASYVIVDRSGDVEPDAGVPGLYLDDMRYVSQLSLMVRGKKPCVIASTVSPDNAELRVQMTAEDGAIEIDRRVVVQDGRVHQQIVFSNQSCVPVSLPVEFPFNSDFRDMFQIRCSDAVASRQPIERRFAENKRSALAICRGKDEITRHCALSLGGDTGVVLDEYTKASARLELAPGETKVVAMAIGAPLPAGEEPTCESYRDALAALRAKRQKFADQGPKITFLDRDMQNWWDRSLSDIAMLTNDYDTGPYVCAGLPWFAVPFGRDGILTAMQMLWARPDIAKGALAFLAERQADQTDERIDAEPGKIMHETRACESCNIGEQPFKLYYGGADTTMLFVILAEQYLGRTGDTAFIEALRCNVDRALDWIEQYGENEDGLVVYEPKSEKSIGNQCWMDSADSIVDEHGNSDLPFPRAVCEIQGYAYAAWKAGAKFATIAGDMDRAQHCEEKARRLFEHFNEKFWDAEHGYYYRALVGVGKSGQEQPCRVKGSNMGQLLFTGIVPEDRAASVAGWMVDSAMFSGFGVRTLASDEAGYQRTGYHRGTVWPHDNAVIAGGLGRTGHVEAAAEVFEGMLAAARGYDWRLPELFAGDERAEGRRPADYPSACSPQAWAAATPFQLVQAVLGLRVDAKQGLRLDGSAWKEEWGDVVVEGLEVGGERLDFRLIASKGGAVLHRPGESAPGESAPNALDTPALQPV